ncbi:hypothetical protein [Nocardia tengchongensis]|uniref:hypothetical protein n=1 Tax=Nocardia tengchongensis TaxID=2055889 RepID=UPI00369199FA
MVRKQRRSATTTGGSPDRRPLKQDRNSVAVTELRQFEGRGHSLTVDSGWKDVADAVLARLAEQGP